MDAPEKPQLGQKLTMLAERILDDLLSEDNNDSLAARVDALKAIGSLHLGLEKLSGKGGNEIDETEVSFQELRQRAQGAK